MDGHVCAYVGLHRQRWGDERSAVIGSVDSGYIVTPLDERWAARWRDVQAGVGGRRRARRRDDCLP